MRTRPQDGSIRIAATDGADEVLGTPAPVPALAGPWTRTDLAYIGGPLRSDGRARPAQVHSASSAGAQLQARDRGRLAGLLERLTVPADAQAQQELVDFLRKRKLEGPELARVGRLVLSQLNSAAPAVGLIRGYFEERGVDLFPRDAGYRAARDTLAARGTGPIDAATAKTLTAQLQTLCHAKDFAGARWAVVKALRDGGHFADAQTQKDFLATVDRLGACARDARELAWVADEALAGRGDVSAYAHTLRDNPVALHALRRALRDRLDVAYSRVNPRHGQSVGQVRQLQQRLKDAAAADKPALAVLLAAAQQRQSALQAETDVGPLRARAEAANRTLLLILDGRFDSWGVVLEARRQSAAGADPAAAARISAAALVSDSHTNFYSNMLFLLASEQLATGAEELREAFDKLMQAFARALSDDEYYADGSLRRTASERAWDETLQRRLVDGPGAR